jgi:hypothetical protein
MSTGERSFRRKYSFTEPEYYILKRILSDLYDEVSSAGFPQKTKTKLFEMLGKLITNTEKDYTNLDNFWTIISRIEIAYRVYGHNMIPRNLKELLKLIWRVQCRTEGKSAESSPPVQL